jgi:hypothetical protein
LRDANNNWVEEVLHALHSRLTPNAISKVSLREWLKIMCTTGPHAILVEMMATMQAQHGAAIPDEIRGAFKVLKVLFSYDGAIPTRFGASGELPCQEYLEKTSHTKGARHQAIDTTISLQTTTNDSDGKERDAKAVHAVLDAVTSTNPSLESIGTHVDQDALQPIL